MGAPAEDIVRYINDAGVVQRRTRHRTDEFETAVEVTGGEEINLYVGPPRAPAPDFTWPGALLSGTSIALTPDEAEHIGLMLIAAARSLRAGN